jgi:single-stranded DNA-binding protein
MHVNTVFIDGYVGGLKRKEDAVFVRIVHKERYFDKKLQEMIFKDHWITVGFWGKKADKAEEVLENNTHVVIEGSLQVYPPEGVESRLRMIGKQFSILDKDAMRKRIDPLPDDAFDDDSRGNE